MARSATCKLCGDICPARCILIEAGPDRSTKRGAPRATIYDRHKRISCGHFQEACRACS